MNRTLLLLLLLSLSFITLKSQSKWSVGPTISLGFSGEQQFDEVITNNSFSAYSSLISSKVQPSFGAGFSAERYLGKRWGISLGVRYNFIQSYNFSEFKDLPTLFIPSIPSTASYSSDKDRLIAHQLQAPLQARFYFGKKETFRPFLSAGGVLTYTFNARLKSKHLWSSSGVVNYSSNDTQYPLGKDWSTIKLFNGQAIFGAGVDFNVFSIEISRIQNVLTQHNYTLSRLALFDSYLHLEVKKIHSTLMTIKYKL